MPFYVPVDELLGGAILGSESVTLPGYASTQTLVTPVVGAVVDVYARGTQVHAACFEDQHGAGVAVAQPLTTDATGLVVDGAGNRVYTAQPAELDIHVSGGGLVAARTIPVGRAADATLAPIDSPAFTGNPTAPTPAPGDNDTSVATTAFVTAAVTVEATRAQGAEGTLAPLASPALSGNPTAPTQVAGDSSTRLATTAFVAAATAPTVPATQQAAAYTFRPADAGTVVESTAAGAVTFTLDTHANQAIPVGAVIEVFQYGAGQVTIAAAAGVTLRSDGAKVKSAAQYATVGLRQRAQDEWVLSGDLA